MSLELKKDALSRRKNEILDLLDKSELDGLCLFSPHFISRLTGFNFLPTERPIAYILSDYGETMIIPRLEKEHLEIVVDDIDDVIIYPDYPGETHPMEKVESTLNDYGFDNVGVDTDGYGSSYGYFGPSLSELADFDVEDIREELERSFAIKYKEEIELLKESARWERLGMEILKEKTEVGKSEIDITMDASKEASEKLLDDIGDRYEQSGMVPLPIHSYYRGQVGKGSALPHALATNETIKDGDILGGTSVCVMDGYFSELERTFVVGDPSEKQKKYFEMMVDAQQIAFDEIRPGIKMSDVEKKVKEYYKEKGIMKHWRHHTGHGLGTRVHEPPFFDVGDDWEIKENMVLSVEPGIYLNDYGGFRHSDTVVVRKKGVEIITKYPGDLENCTIKG